MPIKRMKIVINYKQLKTRQEWRRGVESPKMAVFGDLRESDAGVFGETFNQES